MENYRIQPDLTVSNRKEIKIKKFYNVVIATDRDSWGIREDLGITYKDISSAFVMYKLACLFPSPTMFYNIDNYKNVWHITLKDVKTDEMITIYDWKGGISFGECQESSKETIKNLKKFIKLYILGDCPHPYDNLIAGSVA